MSMLTKGNYILLEHYQQINIDLQSVYEELERERHIMAQANRQFSDSRITKDVILAVQEIVKEFEN